jgi:hypothetical protein
MPVEHDHSADTVPVAVGARTDGKRDPHEVLFRCRTPRSVCVHSLIGVDEMMGPVDWIEAQFG